MRAEADAILAGIGNRAVRRSASDLPDARHVSIVRPVRVILDAKLRIPLSTAIVGTAREVSGLGACGPKRVAGCRGHF